jgi:hypothetical protein
MVPLVKTDLLNQTMTPEIEIVAISRKFFFKTMVLRDLRKLT